jgi:hypothetical protein
MARISSKSAGVSDAGESAAWDFARRNMNRNFSVSGTFVSSTAVKCWRASTQHPRASAPSGVSSASRA